MKKCFKLSLPALGLLYAAALAAQTPSDSDKHHEISLQIGATITPQVSLQNGTQAQFNSAFTLGAEYSYRLLKLKGIAISPGIDFIASPLDAKLSNPPANVTPQYAFLFLTPNVRVTVRPNGAIRPFGLFGGGYANFASTVPAVPLVEVRGNGSGGAFEFGGGIDTKPLITLPKLPILGALPVGARFEVRDWYSSKPNYGLPTGGGLQNQIAFTGGLLLHL